MEVAAARRWKLMSPQGEFALQWHDLRGSIASGRNRIEACF